MQRISGSLSFRIVASGIAGAALDGRVAATAPGVLRALAEELVPDAPAVAEVARLFGDMVEAGDVRAAGRLLADFLDGKAGVVVAPSPVGEAAHV